MSKRKRSAGSRRECWRETARAGAFVPAEENVLRVPHVAVDDQRDPQVLAQTVGDQPIGEDLLAVLALSRVNSDGGGACRTS